MGNPTAVKTDLLLDLLRTSKEAGDAILEVYDSDFAVEHKDDKSPLTLADKRADEIIKKKLSDTSIPILSEEGKAIDYNERKGWEYFWLVDPLDGTKEFVKRNGEFTVNIALIHNGRPLSGVIYVPVQDIFYFADEHVGAYKLIGSGAISDGSIEQVIKVSKKLPLINERSAYTVVASRSHMSDETKQYMDKLKEEHGNIDILSVGSSLKICMIAEGRADVYPRVGPTMEWDTAAGQAILEHAGGELLEFDTLKPLRYNKENLLNPWFIARHSG